MMEEQRDLGISVIIPDNRCGQFLERSVKSVLKQTKTPDEIIIVSNEINNILLYKIINEAKLRNVKLVTHIIQEAAPGERRNQGAKLSSCSILAFLDDDDAWAVQYLREVHTIFCKQETDLVVTWQARQGADGILSNGKHFDLDAFYNEPYLKNHGAGGSNIAVTKSAFSIIGGFERDWLVSEDKDFMIRCMHRKLKISVLQKERVIVYENNLSITQNNENKIKKISNKIFFGIRYCRFMSFSTRLYYFINLVKIFLKGKI